MTARGLFIPDPLYEAIRDSQICWWGEDFLPANRRLLGENHEQLATKVFRYP
jgi:hypothetical protein